MGESRHNRIRKMVENARHESVTADRLDNDIVTPAGTDLLNKATSTQSSKTTET